MTKQQLTVLLAVAAALPAAGIEWERQAVALPEVIWGAVAADMDADGKLEGIAIGETAIYGVDSFREKPVKLVDFKAGHAIHAAVLDMDQDGDQDVVVGRYENPHTMKRAGESEQAPQGPDVTLGWIENVGELREGLPLHVIDNDVHGIHGVATGDLNGDGVGDIVCSSIRGPEFPQSVAAFIRHPDAEDGQRFERIVLDAVQRPHYLDVADLNGDERNDVLVGSSVGGAFTYWANPGGEGEWQRHTLAEEEGATNILAADVNEDGAVDVVIANGHGTGVAWLEGPDWQRHVIDAEVTDAHALAVGDLDGDGDVDAAIGSFGEKLVRWYENEGAGKFTAHTIDEGNDQMSYDLQAVDWDGDGRLDLLLAGRNTQNLVLYRNLNGAKNAKKEVE